MSFLRLSVYSPNTNTFLGFLPKPQSVEVSYVLSDPGALKLTYPQGADGAALLGQPCEILVETPPASSGGIWSEPNNSRFLYLRDERDSAVSNGVLTIEAPSDLVRWQKAVVPYVNLDGNDQRTYTNSTVGYILNDLFTEAQARGALAGLTWDFTATRDSAVLLWDANHTLAEFSLSPGTDFLSVLQGLRDQGYIEYAQSNRILHVYAVDKASAFSKDVAVSSWAVDLMAQGMVLQVGREVAEVPTRRSWEGLLSAAIVAGDYATQVTRTNGTTPWGRWETFVNAAGTDDTAALNKAGDQALADGSSVKQEKTLNLALGSFIQGGPGVGPTTLTRAGAFIGLRDTDATNRVRILGCTLTEDGNGNPGGNVTVQERFSAEESVMANKVGRVTNGFGTLDIGVGTPAQGAPASQFGGVADNADVAGTFVGAVIPTATQGRTFTTPDGVLRGVCQVTGYSSTTTVNIVAQLYIDGVYAGDMILRAGTVANAHQTLPLCSFQRTVTAGTHYWFIRTLSGNFDANDRASIHGVVTPG